MSSIKDMPSTIGSIFRLLGAEQDLGDIIRHIIKTHNEIDETTRGLLLYFANKAERSEAVSEVLWDKQSDLEKSRN